MSENNHLIYRLESPTGKSYIGLTKNFNQRMWQHQNENHRPDSYISRAIQKHGFDKFKKYKLHRDLSLDEANRLEIFEIKCRNTLAPNGYNLHTGGNSHEISESTRLKQSIASKGRKQSEESIAKRVAKIKGRKYSDEHRLNISNSRKGKTASDAAKLNMSISGKGRKVSKIVCKNRSDSLKIASFMIEKENFLNYMSNNTLPNEFRIIELSDILSITMSPIVKRIQRGVFKGAIKKNDVASNRNSVRWFIPKDDVITYYNMTIEEMVNV